LELVEQWCKKEGYDLNDSVFYSDSINDLPLLSRVKKPIAVNPDALLEEKCLENGWEIINLPKI
jgi:phosphoserine phosphatase